MYGPDQTELMKKFRGMYKIRHIPAARICSDQILNAFKKEFERYLPTPFDFSRIKTQAEGHYAYPIQAHEAPSSRTMARY